MYLLDTNVISEMRKSVGNANVKAWVGGQHTGSLYL